MFVYTCTYMSYICRILIKLKHYICEYVSKKFEQYILYIVKTLETNLEKNNSL